jgi:predicted RNase H-like HicB family nuclease
MQLRIIPSAAFYRGAETVALRLEASMRHYLAILIEDEFGEWRALLPDAPECEAKGFTPDDARYAATTALSEFFRRRASTTPLPMDMNDVQQSEEWLARKRIQLSKAVVTMVPIYEHHCELQGS